MSEPAKGEVVSGAIKPPLPEAGYTSFGQGFQGANRCYQQGNFLLSTKLLVQKTIIEVAQNRY